MLLRQARFCALAVPGGQQGNRIPVLFVLVPGAMLYPKDFKCLRDALVKTFSEDDDLFVAIAIAAVDWSKAFSSEESMTKELHRSIETAVSMAQVTHGFCVRKGKDAIYENVVVALHSMAVIAANNFEFLRATSLVLLGATLTGTKNFWPSLYSYPIPVLSIFGDLDGQAHLVKAALAIQNGLAGVSTEAPLSIVSRRAFSIIKGANHAHFSNDVVNFLRGDLKASKDQKETANDISAIINHFVKVNLPAGSAIRPATILSSRRALLHSTVEAASLVSPYLEALRGTPSFSVRFLSEASNHQKYEENEFSSCALRLAHGAEMISFVHPVLAEVIAHPGEIAKAECFVLNSQKRLLSGLLDGNHCLEQRTRLSVTVHTSMQSFQHSLGRITVLQPGRNSQVCLHLQCFMKREAYGSEYNPLARISPVYLIKGWSLKNITEILKNSGIEFEEENVHRCVTPADINNDILNSALMKLSPEFRNRYEERGIKIACRENPIDTLAEWLRSTPNIERKGYETVVSCPILVDDNDSNNMEQSQMLYYQCPSMAWFMEYIMIGGLRNVQ